MAETGQNRQERSRRMVTGRSIVVNGDLGSGKTTVTVGLAETLGLRRISIGDLYRQMAQERGMTALQLNLHAELDDAVDGYVDQLQAKIAASGEQLIVDSRLAWVFFKDAFKIHLVTDPTVAALRVLTRPANDVERYASLEEALERLNSRSESERMRFLTRYGADKHRLRNYDLICDTTAADSAEVIEHSVAAFEGRLGAEILRQSPPLLLLDPSRIHPTADVAALNGLADDAGEDDPAIEPLHVGKSGHEFFLVDGHRNLSVALRSGRSLVPARLAAEDDEPVVDGVSAHEYFRSQCTPSRLQQWQESHGMRADLPTSPSPAA
jgi:predicted cytidylate kinase